MVKNIILDMGNVLLDYDPEVPLEVYLDSEEDREIIKRELFEGPEWIQGDLGNITIEEKFESIQKRIPQRLQKGLWDCLKGWHLFMPPVDGAFDFVNRAKKEGYSLYVLSNASDEFYVYFPKHYDARIFEGIVVSADLHMIKPDERIYQYLLNRYQICPEESLFIDDRPENVETAVKQGMKAVVFRKNFDEIAEKFSLWR